MAEPKKTVSVGAADMATAFAGLPQGTKLTAGDKLPGVPGVTPPTAAGDPYRGYQDGPDFPPHTVFTLSPKQVSSAYNLDADWLRVGIKELEPFEERQALENGGKNPLSVQAEMTKAGIVRLGDKAPSYAEKEAWLKAIGPKGRRLVDLAFQSLNFMSDSEGEEFLATGTPVRG